MEKMSQSFNENDDDTPSRIKTRIHRYNRRITYFSDILKRQNKLKQDLQPQELATLRTPNFNYSEIANEAAIYFQQGLEMLRTARSMHENSSPLVEYYGFLQCVKGITILELEIKDARFFSYHGLTRAKANSHYINAKIKPIGVFSALLLRIKPMGMSTEEAMDYFFSEPRCLSLEEALDIKARPYNKSYSKNYLGDPIFAFIGSWLLSSLVRYHPKK